MLHELKSLIYTHDVFRGQKLKRGYAQFGYSYETTSRRLTVAPPIPPFLQAAIRRATFFVPELRESIIQKPTTPYYPTDILFTQCIVTHYPPGAGILVIIFFALASLQRHVFSSDPIVLKRIPTSSKFPLAHYI